MKTRLLALFLSLALVVPALVMLPVKPTQAAGTTSIHIVKYAADGTTILEQTTVDIATLEQGTVQGDGTTHYYTQGPTFDPNNLWDPDELCPDHGSVPGLKDKGALKGTDIKDLCELVGGMTAADTVDVRASDGYGDMYDYANVYTPDPRQGKMVISWWKDGHYSGSGPDDWQDGMMLAFFPTVARPSDGKLIFGHQDMHDCLPSYNWHFYWDGDIQYPSVHGHYVKYVSEISIYTDGANQWTLDLAGAGDETIRQSHYQNCVACHNPPGGTWTYTDSEDHVWSGLPLWYVLGRVDDGNVHGPNSFNNGLYYDVKVIAEDYEYTFSSTQLARNDTIILANKMDGAPLPPDKYPLKLVSPDFTVGGPSVAGIERIELNNISMTPPSYPPIEPTDAEWPLTLYGAHPGTLTANQFEGCLGSGSCHATTYADDSGTWRGIPLWRLMGYVDDIESHDYNDNLALNEGGYDVWVIAADGYYYDFPSTELSRNNNIILASELNGQPLPAETGVPGDMHPAYPMKVVGPGLSSGSKVGAVVRIDLRNFPDERPAWDLNGDGWCNMGDVRILGSVWNSHGDHNGWIPEDVNNDSYVNMGDVRWLGAYWGQEWP